jgi:hypothetical protein
LSTWLTEGSIIVQVQGKNIIAYAEYLVQRATAYGSTKVDYVRAGEGRLKKLTVDKGLLRETESVQDQIRALLKCDVGTYVENIALGFGMVLLAGLSLQQREKAVA